MGLWARLRHVLPVLRFVRRLGYVPRIAAPRTFNEKLLWRKIFDRSPAIGRLSDKLHAKAFFAERCPGLAQAELRWVGGDPSGIPDEALSGQVVVKSNCGSGQYVFSFDGGADVERIRRHAEAWIGRGRPYGRSNLEWGYSQVEPRILVESLIRDEAGDPPFNVNVHAMDGAVVLAHVWRKTREGAEADAPDLTAVYDAGLKRLAALPLRNGRANATFPDAFEPPPSMAAAYEHARILSRGMDYVRVDFLCTPRRAHAGEITFYTHAGFIRWTDAAIEARIAGMWDLRKSWFLSTPQKGWRGRYARALKRLIDRESRGGGQLGG